VRCVVMGYFTKMICVMLNLIQHLIELYQIHSKNETLNRVQGEDL